MAPSRGFTLLRLRTHAQIPFIQPRRRFYSSFIEATTSPSSKTQIYISRSLDPYLNLSIEHYLLQKTPEESTILFLYTNSRSLIIGRNQNPWTEVRLGSIADPINGAPFQLVRRRSGGGTVMHDEGNVNYSVICPSKIFNRDKHAEMVVSALKGLGVDKVRVNCRHDIVVDRLVEGEGEGEKTFKVSGSAYKLTRLRSLHHGTCLLNSPNLKLASTLLDATGKQWITARGVESVRSAITNVNVKNEDFEGAVVKEFNNMYDTDTQVTIVGEEEGEIPEIAKGMEELKSEDWIFNQTPQFTFTTEIPNRANTVEGQFIPDDFKASFTIRHGRITECDILHSSKVTHAQATRIQTFLLNRPLRSISIWQNDVFLDYLPHSNDPALALTLLSEISDMPNPGLAFDYIFGTEGAELLIKSRLGNDEKSGRRIASIYGE